MNLISKEENDKVEQIMAMNRKARRSLGKQFKTKIPGSQVPFSKAHALWRP